ncbi:serine/threonine-protein kinase [Paraliomyxa miuraensis]|uniref:serine/threonine-protein kinase n=1 Tax=Paraliomyxa miuraensis TaxID=376150 RepID=UPI00224EF368|nr:serine/threonine-protein kinase [Paraliomyxa miuraensis]MCX4247088.1 serine/threonine-protein kinase [Paraliomyxa miuraensis]
MQDERTDALAEAIRSLATVEDPLASVVLEGVRRRLNLSHAPRRIDRFVLGEPLGAGGMGMVYAADDPRLERRVAIKLLRTPGAEGARRGLREARALARLSHPNVVTIYEAGLHEGQVFVVMELVEGRSLRQWLHTPRSWREICEVMLAAGRGLAAAHAVDIVHRDFKPDNVLVGERVRVADFGLAHAIDHDSQPTEPRTAGSDRAPTGRHAAGTLGFMAPEQLRGVPVDPRTDQFAFCATFVRALTERDPFTGDTPEARLQALEHGLPPTAPAGVPRWLWAVLAKGLHPSPEHRHARLDQLLDVIDRRLQPRRWIGPTVATLTVIGAIVITWWTANAREFSCHEAEQAIDEVWSPARRDAVTAAFEATGKSYAAHASTFVSTSLDRYASDWADARVDACRAEQAGRASTHQVDCLERRREEVLSLLELFEGADADVVQRASQVVSAMPPPSTCMRPDALDDVSSTTDEASRAELERLRGEITRAWALGQVGRYAQGNDALEPLLPRLRALEHMPTLAEALLQHGRLQVRLGELDAAHRSLKEAVRLGLLARADRIVASAAVALCDELTTQGEFVRAHEAAELAGTLHERLTGERTWPMLVNLEGALLVREHRDAEAAEVLAEGIAACNEDDPRQRLDSLSMHGNLAAALMRLGRLDEAEVASEHGLALVRGLFGEQHPMFAISLIAAAAIRDARGDTEGALRIGRHALAVWQQAVPEPTPVTASMIHNAGLYLLTLERRDEALVALREALALWERLLPPGHSRLALAHTSIGRGLRGQGAYAEAMDHHRRALELIANELERDEPMAGELLNQAARTALAAGQRELADPWIEQGLRICTTAPNPVLEGELRFLRARSLSMRGEQDRAVHEAEAALELLRGGQEHAQREVEAWLADQGRTPEP